MNHINEYIDDDWPTMSDGSDFDGKQLLTLVRRGQSPFKDAWDVNLLIREIEDTLGARVVDIPFVSMGSNHYGFHIRLSNTLDIVARLARGDVNMPNFVGFPVKVQVSEVEFEAEAYELLRSDPVIMVSRLLHYRIPVQCAGPRLNTPEDIVGRRLFLFERSKGEKNVWDELSATQRMHLLTQCAHIRASLFNFGLTGDFVSKWLLERLFEHKPEVLPIPVAPTRDFVVALFTSKIEATIKNIGDMIGWEGDNAIVGPIAFAAKQSLLRLIPHILPKDDHEASLYRLVLDHGDYGIHNMSIMMENSGQPLVTSLYDWEAGCIAPAILSDPTMQVSIGLVADMHAAPSITRFADDASPERHAEFMSWSEHYFKALYDLAPDYENAIQAGKDARHLWFALRDWRGDNAEGFFGELGAWAEKRIKELGVVA